jgi:AcrR family transcriptional regulator
MGNREDLLDGAVRCLYEKGYVNTTARGIAAASGVSLAAIGYHFGSKETLMNEALIKAMSEWGQEIERALTANVESGAAPAESFAATWDRVIESIFVHPRLWATQFELVGLSDQSPEMRDLFTKGSREARLGLAAIFQGLDPVADEPKALVVGTFFQLVLTGFAAQWLTDPDSALSGADLATALRAVADTLS